MSVKFRWLGHSAFHFMIGNTFNFLVDPFLTGNPLGAASANEMNPDVILVTHAHGDHVGDTVAIAKRTGALVVSNNEMANWFDTQGVPNVFGGNPGGTFRHDIMTAKWTIAHHSSSFADGTYGGQPNGFIITARGRNMYFAGDTALFMDMQLIGEIGLDVAFLPIGDTYTMGLEDSIRAIQFLKPKVVVPMHYNTFPPIVQDVVAWAEMVNRETMAQPVVVDPGGEYTLD